MLSVLAISQTTKAISSTQHPERVAQRLAEWLEIRLLDTVCELQAGQGGIADHMDTLRRNQLAALRHPSPEGTQRH